MKTLAAALLLLATTLTLRAEMTFTNDPIPTFDHTAYAGKWYSLTSIPTPMDKDWLQTAETYTRTPKGYDVLTTYRKQDDKKQRELKSKLFDAKNDQPQGALKARFFGLLYVDYTILALTNEYSVVGHPKKKYLFIMSRTPSLPKETLDAIIARCKQLGYPTEKLKSQQHHPQ